MAALPGVVAAGVSNRGPPSGEGSNLGLEVGGSTGGSAIAAQRLRPNENAIGKRFRLGGDRWIEVIGVVGDVRSTLQKNPNMTVYLPFWQRERAGFVLHVRTAMDPMAIASVVRGEIRQMDAGLVVPRMRTVASIVDASVAQRQFQLTLVLVFAVTALLLAAIGVYGVVAQSVAQRTNEIGIRLALGASRADVWRLVARHGLAPVMGGLCAGLAGAVVATRLVSGFLFGVKAIDPVTFGAVALVLLAAAAAACWWPALRATRVDPLVALRYE